MSSDWTGLNQHLLADIWKMRKQGNMWMRDTSSPVVSAAFTEGNLEILLNWQSPFENSGTEAQAPTVAAMLQTGSLQPLIGAVTGNATTGLAGDVKNGASGVVGSFEGRTGITKMNSTQVFSAMQPIKVTGTLVLRAWRDPDAEVEAPLAKLMEWALPQYLSADGSVLARAIDAGGGGMSTVEALMPSKAPVVVSMRYKARLFKDMVIESIGLPLDSPINARGRFVSLRLPITLCSLTAIDRDDWKAMQPI